LNAGLKKSLRRYSLVIAFDGRRRRIFKLLVAGDMGVGLERSDALWARVDKARNEFRLGCAGHYVVYRFLVFIKNYTCYSFARSCS
jgi:hypothetical protein